MKKFLKFFAMAVLAISVCACEGPDPNNGGNDGNGGGSGEEPVLELVNGTFYQINNNGGDIEVEVSTNTTYEVNIPEDVKEWVALTDTRTETNKILVFTIEKNKSGSSREAKVTISYGNNKSVEFSIYQASSQEGEKTERPDDALSTLYDNLTKDFAGAAMAWADCYGDYRYYNTGTGQFMWQIYLQDYDARDQLLIELLAPSFEGDLVLPLGTFPVAEKRWVKDAIIPGSLQWDGEYSCYIEAYSWYLRTKKSSTGAMPTWPPVYEDRAPIKKGWLKIEEEILEDGGVMHIISFSFEDDAYNTISGSYRGPVYMGDAR